MVKACSCPHWNQDQQECLYDGYPPCIIDELREELKKEREKNNECTQSNPKII